MNWSEYQENTYRTKPNYLAVFLANKMEFHSIIDLGCGSGNDSVYMVKKGKKVTAIDANVKEEYILDRITEKEKQAITICKESFENVTLPDTDCILSMFALPFCEPSKFLSLWNKINHALPVGGILAANLFGERDWHKIDKLVNIFTKEEVLELLSDFEIIKWKEQEYTGETDNTHWHYYDFVAKKKSR